jgi:succinate dehydrogenase / fumarate reductase, iron-sulfur subunit
MENALIIDIYRQRPADGKPGKFQRFTVEGGEGMTVLDCLERIRLTLDPTLVYRHSCHHSCCGTCALRINGREALACITPAQSLNSGRITLEPLKGLEVIADLAVDMGPFYGAIPEGCDYLRPSESRGKSLPAGVAGFTRFENCIECGACVSSCPVSRRNTGFIGPAALAAVNNELAKGHGNEEAMLSLAAAGNGAWMCEKAFECSRVCPTKVYPARHIMELRDKTGS